jgi:hypothetical protein
MTFRVVAADDPTRIYARELSPNEAPAKLRDARRIFPSRFWKIVPEAKRAR